MGFRGEGIPAKWRVGADAAEGFLMKELPMRASSRLGRDPSTPQVLQFVKHLLRSG